MTRKDYVKIAAVLRKLGEDGAGCFDCPEDRLFIAQHFSDMLETDNPRFNRTRFINAALPEPTDYSVVDAADSGQRGIEDTDESDTYRIDRHFECGIDAQVIKTGLTREQAQEHCCDPESSSTTATSPLTVARTRAIGNWFDGYTKV